MTKEEKELLLKDLCNRLPYGVRVQCLQGTELRYDGYKIHELSEDGSYLSLFSVDIPHGVCNLDLDVCEIKPYLRPMDSMTEEEKTKYEYGFMYNNDLAVDAVDYVDWLDKNMFDYRGLIPKGLALPAKEGMYKK